MKQILERQKTLFESTISLIPSENYGFQKDISEIYQTDIGNRYCFYNNSTFSSAFPGHEHIENIEATVISHLKKLFHTDYINISPLSGMNALSIFLAGIGNIGDSIFLVHPRNGGHISTEKIAERLGYKIYFIPFLNGFEINYEELRKMILEYKPKAIYVDQMNSVIPLSMSPIQDLNVVTYYDISHNAAFIIGGKHPNPLSKGYDAFGGSTHKTIPGPQKAFFATNDINIHNQIKQKALCFISNNHIEKTAALGITLEKMEKHWETYTTRILNNNLYFSQQLSKLGATILLPDESYPESHQLFWYFKNKENADIHYALTKIGILTNLLPLPFQDNSIFGFRTGIQELSFLGGEQEDIDIIINCLSLILKGGYNETKLQENIKVLKKNLLSKFERIYD